MSRVIAVMACGFALAACSMSLPSFDFLKSTPTTDVLRIESEPPGADARTTQGQSCRTPCELAVPVSNELAVSFALNGYQPQTVQVRPDVSNSGSSGRMQPNPVFAELQPVRPPPAAPKAPPKKKQTAKKTTPKTEQSRVTDPNSAYPAGYPWPDPQPR